MIIRFNNFNIIYNLSIATEIINNFYRDFLCFKNIENLVIENSIYNNIKKLVEKNDKLLFVTTYSIIDFAIKALIKEKLINNNDVLGFFIRNNKMINIEYDKSANHINHIDGYYDSIDTMLNKILNLE